jgi:hypothetical protein
MTNYARPAQIMLVHDKLCPPITNYARPTSSPVTDPDATSAIGEQTRP